MKTFFKMLMAQVGKFVLAALREKAEREIAQVSRKES